jgi:hypothetical protein
MRICQVRRVNVDKIACPSKESGGYSCERLDPHEDGHFVGQHTIEHAIRGSGYSCEEIK